VNAIPAGSYLELQQQVGSLPPPPAGKIRLFRGQTKDYGTLYSSLGRIRATQPANELFDVTMHHLFIKSALLSVLGGLLKLPELSPLDIQVSAADFTLAEALVQHYGYQTRYIDVSPSLDVALWFATHRFEGGADTPIGDAAPYRLTFPAWHTTAVDPGVIYVLDVNPWDGKSGFAEGDYIDLVAIAPAGENRPRRQAGGLIYAPGPDVSRLVNAKFEIRFPWTETATSWDTDTLFPGPQEDEIYRTLLQAPFFRTVRQHDGVEERVFRRSCTFPEYRRAAEDPERAALYRSYDRTLDPTLYHPWLRRNLDQLVANPHWKQLRAGFEQATPIMLQRPHILFSMHRGGVAEPPASPPPVQQPWNNFFLELSPESFALAYDENRMRRGFWCFWFSPTEFMLQSFGTTEGRPAGSEIAVYQWQPDSGLVQTAGPALMGSYVTLPLDLIRMTAGGLLRLDPPGNIGHGYWELTTTEKFWPALGGWTDLM
jgi:FRG domain